MFFGVKGISSTDEEGRYSLNPLPGGDCAERSPGQVLAGRWEINDYFALLYTMKRCTVAKWRI